MNILDMARNLGLNLKRKSSSQGGEWAGPCPACGGKDRFLVWPHAPRSAERGGSYWCRQCGKQGDGIQFGRDFMRYSFRHACEAVGYRPPVGAMRYRLRSDLTLPDKVPDWEPKATPRYPDLQFHYGTEELLYQIQSGSVDVGGLAPGSCSVRARGITSSTANLFLLGHNATDRMIQRCRLGLSENPEEQRSGTRDPLITIPKGLVIPIWYGSHVVGMKARRDDADPNTAQFGKYYLVPGSLPICGVYHPDPVGKPIVIVESELDAILIYQETAGTFCPVSLGSASNRPDDRVVELIDQAPVVLVALDKDDAGKQGWRWWKAHFPDVVRLEIPQGKDPGEYHLAGGDLYCWAMAGMLRAGYFMEPLFDGQPGVQIRPLAQHGEPEPLWEFHTTARYRLPGDWLPSLPEPLAENVVLHLEEDPLSPYRRWVYLVMEKTEVLSQKMAELQVPPEYLDYLLQRDKLQQLRQAERQRREYLYRKAVRAL